MENVKTEKTPPWFTVNKTSNNDSSKESQNKVIRYEPSGNDFFKFFKRKTPKLILSAMAGMVGVWGNYYAIRYQLDLTRFDMVGSDLAKEFYAVGLSFLLDFMIVIFHLMRIEILMWITTSFTVVIALYANISMIVQGQNLSSTIKNMSDTSTGGGVMIAIMIALLPVITLVYLMTLTLKQYDMELAECEKLNKQIEQDLRNNKG